MQQDEDHFQYQNADDEEQGQLDNAALQRQINFLAQQLQELQGRQQQQKGQQYQLHPHVQVLLPPHLQLGRHITAADRTKITKKYAEPVDFPKAIEDENGLAAKALPQEQRDWTTKTLPKLQRQELESIKIAAAGLHMALSNADGARKFEFMSACLRDIIILSVDNAQKMAKSQLQEAFKAAKAPGAYALCKLESLDSELQLSDNSIFQACHVEAIKTFRSYSSIVQREKVQDYKSRKGNFPRNNYNRGGRGGRGNFRGNFRGGRGGRGGRQERDAQGNARAAQEGGN